MEIWSKISPAPNRENPVRFGELAEAVQGKVVPDTDEVRRISVVSPEQMEGVVEVIVKSGIGKTVTT